MRQISADKSPCTSGRITAFQSNMAAFNRLQADITGDVLQRLAEEVLDREELFGVWSRVEHERYLPIADGYLLVLYLPLVQKEALEVYRSATDLIVRIGNFKRSIPLPNSLRHAEIVSARLADQELTVHLREEVPHEK